MTIRPWNWNNFKWWLSDNPFLWQEGQFQEWINIDVQTEPSGFKLVSDFESYLVTASAPNVIIDLADYGWSWIITFCAWWEIYKDTSTTPIYTDIAGSEIKQATAAWVSWTLYIYYFPASWTIHRIATDWTWHTTKGSLTWSTTYPLIKYGWDIYFGDANVFRKLKCSDWTETLSAIFTAAPENTFTGITFFQDTFTLYSKVWTTTNPRDWQQFKIVLWETSPEYIVKWDRLPILWACNQWAIDYVVTGAWPNYSDLYQSSWTQRQLIKSNFESMTLGRKFNWKIVTWKDELFLLWFNQESASSVNGNSIFRLWQYFPWMPQALTEIYRWNAGWVNYCIFPTYNYLYFGKKWTSNIYTVSRLNLDTPIASNYQNSWSITSLIFNGWDATLDKSLTEINISYMCDSTNPYFPHGWTIALYGRKNPWSAFTQIGSSITPTDIWNIRIVAEQIKASGLWDFKQLELKCTITRGSVSLSPLVTWIKVYYDDNIKT